MLNDLLKRQLQELGIDDPTNPPDVAAWGQLLQQVSTVYDVADDRRLYQSLFDQTNDAVFIIDLTGKFLPVNRKAAEMLGYTVVELVRLATKDMVIPNEVHEVTGVVERLLLGEKVPPYERNFIRKDKSVLTVDINIELVRDVHGNPLYIQSVVRDITERKRDENALRFQATLVEHMHDATIATDLDYRVISWNQAAEQMYGWSAQEAIGRPASEVVVSHHTRAQREEINRTVLDTGYWEGEILHRHRDGTLLNVFSSISLLSDAEGRPLGVLGINRDITTRKQTQEALRLSEEKYRQLFNAAQWQTQELTLLNRIRTAVAIEMDLAPLIRTIVKAIAEIFNYTHVSLYLLEGENLILYHQIGYEEPYSVIPLSKGIIGRTTRIGEPTFVEDVRLDPDYVPATANVVSEICVPLFDRDRLVGVFNIESTGEKVLTNDDMRLMIAISEQISIALERARLYTSLRESKDQYQTVLESVREIIFQTDAQAHWTFLNPAWTEITGYSVEKSIGQLILDVIHPDDRRFVTEKYNQLVNGEIAFCRCEARLVTQDGGVRWVEMHGRRAADPGGHLNGMSGTLTDITERKRSEQQAAELLAQSRTVEALRRFLSNVSHDLRTPLSVIKTSLYLLRRKYSDPQTAVHHLDVLEEQVSHLTRVVEDLVEMSRLEDQVVEFEFIPVHLGNLVRDVLVSYESMAQNKHLTIQQMCDPDLPLIQADQMWLGKLVRNLVMNAVQYTHDGGTIWLTTSARDGGTVLEVQDTGIGISADDLPYIFDRFYRADAARPADKGGAGLGLAIVRKVVDAHQGHVDVESTLGQGSTFRVWLPVKHKI